MSEEKKDAIALHTGSGMELRTVADHKQFAMTAYHSGFLGNASLNDTEKMQTVAKAMMTIQYGAEVGVGPYSALQGIHIIQGKPSMSAGLMAALIKKSGLYRFKELKHTDQACSLEFYELVGGKWDIAGTSTFTWEDAKTAELTTGKNKHSWKKYPRNMLFARALSNGARWFCQDIFCGAVYTGEEAREAAIEASWTAEPEPVKEQKTSSLMASTRLAQECHGLATDPLLNDTFIAVQLARVGDETTSADALQLLDKALNLVGELKHPNQDPGPDDSAEPDENPPEEPPMPDDAPEPGSRG